jgi:DNA-binding NarL/FixJ family response regulator
VSKKRPSKSPPRAVPKIIDRFSPGYWRTRVYRNTYTHRGRRYLVSRWSVKIQVAGVRRTFSLKSANQDAAAAEALELYQRLATEGPPAETPEADATDNETTPRASSAAGTPNVDRTSPAYWKPRLIRRKYTARLPGQNDTQWSVLIEHRGEREYFPLGTADEDAAARAAAERFGMIASHGWKQARLSYFREVTVGICWSTNPFACSYATVLAIPATEPGEPPEPERTTGKWQKVIVVEPDFGVRRALGYWLSRQEQAATRVVCVEPDEAAAALRAAPDSLTLVNFSVSSPQGTSFAAWLGEQVPKAGVFGYGVFDDSDHIFASLSGVTGGYLLRRRLPGQLLEPVLHYAGRSRGEAPAADQLARRYFERLFEFADGRSETPEANLLTSREYEILSCLGKGFQDKEIADRLGISVWTVHSHLRKIFVKYRVHSRTEAVVKYLRL